MLDTPWGSFPLEWVYFVAGSIGFTFLLTWVFFRRRQPDLEPVDEAWEDEASGLSWPVPVTADDRTSISYKIQYSKSMKPVDRLVKHSHPYTPVGTSQRVFMVPRGSTVADDPRKNFVEGQDQDDPEPLIQESAAWYRRAREMVMSGGLRVRGDLVSIMILWFGLVSVGGFFWGKVLLGSSVLNQ